MTIGDLNQKSGPRIVVPKPANDEQIQSYVNDGYLVMPSLIESAELEELKDEIVKLARGRYPVRDLPALSPDAQDSALSWCCHRRTHPSRRAPGCTL